MKFEQHFKFQKKAQASFLSRTFLIRFDKKIFFQLRVLKTEQSVEEIVKEQTLKAFNARCRQYYQAESY